MSVADLSPGDKLSLKGKIFELQKKLNLLDVEQQNTEDYSFQPEITNYKLPHRENNFIDNMKRAEESRKERLESLKEMVMLETGGDYTYKPSINKMSKSIKSEKPAHIRLTEKGKEYQASLEEKKKEAAIYDSNGRRLFIPQRLVRKIPVVESEMDVDEYLYRDAQDRIERRQLTIEEDTKELEKLSTEKKINKKSELLVRRKYERELRSIYETLTNMIQRSGRSLSHYDGKVTITEFQLLTEEIQSKYIQYAKDLRKLKNHVNQQQNDVVVPQKSIITTSSDPYDLVDKIWRILDPEENGYITVQTFIAISLPSMLSRGGNVVSILASSPQALLSDCNSDLSLYTDTSLLYQYLLALTSYITSQQQLQQRLQQQQQQQQYLQQQSSQDTKTYSFAHQKDFETSSNISNSDSISQRIINYNQVLEERSKMSKLRMEELRYQLYEEQMRECTFRPQITQNIPIQNHIIRNDSDDNLMYLPAHERLYQQKDKIPKSIQENKHRQTGEKELDECTFQPNIFHSKSNKNKLNKSGNNNNNNNNIHNLVSNNKIPFQTEYDSQSETDDNSSNTDFSSTNNSLNFERLKENSTKNSIIEIMKEISTGNEGTSNKASLPIPPPPPPPQPKGYSESIQRMRSALERKKQKEKEDAEVFAFNEENYLKKKQQLATEGCKPFRLRTNERQVEKLKLLSDVPPPPLTPGTPTNNNNNNGKVTDKQIVSPSSLKGYVRRSDGELKPIRLYVEIKLGGGVKGSHIAVADNDVPSELAKSFCKIYSLDSNAESILTEVVTNQMIQGGIPIGTIQSPSKKNHEEFTSLSSNNNQNNENINDHDLDHDDYDYDPNTQLEDGYSENLSRTFDEEDLRNS